MMHRFYCPDLHLHAPAGLSDTAPPAVVRLDADEAHHARRVLRLNPGDAVELFDGDGRRGTGELLGWAGGASVKLHGVTHHPRPTPALDLAVAIPKGPRADEMVNQLGQLGVDRLTPLRAERTVVDPRPGKIEKFQRAAVESARQCGRNYLMEVAPAATLGSLLREAYGVKLMAAPGGGDPVALPERLRRAARVLVLIGPEGGWTDEELAAARDGGAEAWSLGANVLRIEAAACAAAAVVRYLARTASSTCAS
jgi:16S rRNA (uracil1498-N3)-methyltransferase